MVRVVAAQLQAQPNQVPRLELEITHRLVRDQHSIGPGRQGAEDLRGVPAREERVGHVRGCPDGPRIDPVQVLQIVAHVGESVLHRLDGGHAGEFRHGVGDPLRESGGRGRAHRHVGAVG